MPEFQEREYHPDMTEKRPMTAADLMFLAELQKELNTQPNMGNADPLFWMIIQPDERPAPAGDGIPVAVDTVDNSIAARDLESLVRFVNDEDVDGVRKCTYFNRSCTIKYADGSGDSAYSLAELVESMIDHGIERLRVEYARTEDRLVRDALFLTHKDCEDHLSEYGYNYHEKAHAYAMTAVRSPRYAALLELIRTVDWSRFIVGGPA